MMDEIEHTIAELMGVPMEDWPEWLECRDIPAHALQAIEQWLIGKDGEDQIPEPCAVVKVQMSQPARR